MSRLNCRCGQNRTLQLIRIECEIKNGAVEILHFHFPYNCQNSVPNFAFFAVVEKQNQRWSLIEHGFNCVLDFVPGKLSHF